MKAADKVKKRKREALKEETTRHQREKEAENDLGLGGVFEVLVEYLKPLLRAFNSFHLLYQLVAFVISVYALVHAQYWLYCFLLLEIVNRDKYMQAVVWAIYQPGRSLLMTACLGVFLM